MHCGTKLGTAFPLLARYIFLISQDFSFSPYKFQEKHVSLKIHFWLVIANNALLAIAYYVLFILYTLNIYNPWCKTDMSDMIFPEEWFSNSLGWMSSLLVAATLPTAIVGSPWPKKCCSTW